MDSGLDTGAISGHGGLLAWSWAPSEASAPPPSSPACFPPCPPPVCPPIHQPRATARRPSIATPPQVWKARGAPLCYPGPLADTVPPFPCLNTESSPPRPGSRLTLQDLASFRPEVADALAMPLGDYTLYSPPPPAGGAILSFVLNVLKGEALPPRSPRPRVGLGAARALQGRVPSSFCRAPPPTLRDPDPGQRSRW